MARSARNQPSSQAKQETAARKPPDVVDSQLQKRMQVVDSPIPCRTVLYIEVGDMPSSEVREAVNHVSQHYAGNRHPTFVCPLRGGKLTTDVVFEDEVLKFVRSICEVQDDEIVLKGGAQAVDLVRQRI